MNNVYFDDDFLNTTIRSPGATFQALTGGNDTYQVSVSSSNKFVSLAGVSTVALITGSMIADSNIGVQVHVSDTITSVQTSGANITLSAGNDAAIVMAKGASFVADDHTYTLGALGLSRDDSKYLPQGSSTDYTLASNGSATIGLANITSDSYWAGIISADENGVLSVNSSLGEDPILVVDTTDGPNYQFANISINSSGVYLINTVTGSSTNTSIWPSVNTFLISDSSVSVASAFQNKYFAGKNSGVKFYFGNNTLLCFQTWNYYRCL